MRFGGLIAAIVLAAIAAVIVLRMSADKTPAPAAGGQGNQQVATSNIYVAAQPIPVGTTITAEMIAVQPWPTHLVLEGFIKPDSDQKVEGMVSRASFQAQEPILMSKLSNVNDPNFLAGALPKGMRVMTIQTNEVEGVAGFVFPGDYVDVILTHEVSKWVTEPGDEKPREQKVAVTETLITNVKVLAVDQRASGASATDDKGNLIIPRSVSLMVSPTDAQRLRLAQQEGTLTLSLRALADRESSDPLMSTTDKDISQFPSLDDGSTGGHGVIVVRGTKRNESKGDASPAMPPPGASEPVPAGTP